MKNHFFSLLFLFLLPGLAIAQNHNLLLKRGVVLPEARIDWPPANQAYQGYHFRLIQFLELPDARQKSQLAEEGVILMDYLPHYAFIAAIQENVQIDWSAKAQIRAVLEISADWKMDNGPLDGDELWVSYPQVLHADQVIASLESEGMEVNKRNDHTHMLGIRLSSESVAQLASLPYISYIEAMPPPPVEERQHFRSGSRSNYLAAEYGLDGAGLVLAVAEGRIDPTLIDFHNRLDITYHPSTTNAGHATSVGQFMAGAGNENPLNKGMAYGAEVISHSWSIWGNAASLYANPGLRVSNQSWGAGCNAGYNNDARAVDLTLDSLPHFMMVFSTGNSQGSNCGYGAGHGWGTVTGGVKTAKNVISVGALTRYDEVTGFSSFGPATDGRIKPDLSTVGEGGTSFASPTVSGVFAQLHQAYMQHHGGTEPPAVLIKAILQNTADDIGNPGPDFKHGYGKVNARKAFRVIDEGSWSVNSVSNGQQRLLALTVPPHTRELKVMVYWPDVAGAGNAAKALVNDLDMALIAPGGGSTWLPWVLNPSPDSLTLNNHAIRGIDTLNNMEQVTLMNPAAGTYQIRVNGTEVPMGPQTFYVVTQTYQDELVLTYPLGGEGFVPGEKEIIRWDATGAGSFDLAYTMDGGSNWQQLARGIADSLRYYEWTIPDTLQGDVQVRVTSGTMNDTSNDFTIAPLPKNVSVLWACADSIKLTWDSVAQATGYQITQLGALYMDSIETVNTHEVVLHNRSTTDTLWFAVQSLGADGALSRRTIAIRKNPGDFNCIQLNASAEAIVSHPSGYLPDCHSASGKPLGIRIRNVGVSPLTNVPVRYRINGGPVTTGLVTPPIPSGKLLDFYFPVNLNFSFTGSYHIQAWTDMPGDPIATNDTVEMTLVVYAGQTISPQYVQDFDTFMNCTTAWGCSDISCTLSDGWFNVPNVTGDSIDFRTHNGSTGSANTGPPSDHTQGNNSGKYLYLETSGNGGSGCRNQLAYLHSPCLDLRNTNQPTLSFWRHMNGSSIGELHIDVLSDGQWVEDVIPVVSGNQGNLWVQQLVDLSPFQGERVVVRFRATTGNGFSGDLALDDIQLTSLPRSDFYASRQTVCPNDQVTFTDSSFFVDSRQWQFSPNTIAFTGGTSANNPHPQVLFLQPGLYTVTLINTNTAGTDSLIQTAYINAGPHPLALTTNDADNILCWGDSLILTATTNAPSVTFKETGTILQSGPQTSLVIPKVTTSAIYTAVGTLYPGCLTTEPAVFITVNNPRVSIVPQDSAQACEGDSILLSASLGFVGYQWTNGENTQQIFAKSSGFYSVTASDMAGCEAISDSVDVRFFPTPPTPTVAGPAMAFLQAADTFVVSGQPGSSFQWGSLSGVILSARADSLVASWPALGNQTLWVQETTAEGCVGDTFFFQVMVTERVGIASPAVSWGYEVYPNPAGQELFVAFTEVPQSVVSLRLFDVQGRLVEKVQSQEATLRLDLDGLAAGMYWLEIRLQDEGIWEKVWIR